MAYIRPLANGNFRADVRMKGIVKNKTFPSEKLAQAWADKIERSIKTIPNLDATQLIALSDSDVDSMGGAEVFAQLGVDLFTIRNQARLEAITKNGEAKELHFPPVVMVELKRLQEVGSGLLFAGGNPSEPMDFRKAWSKALKQADISETDQPPSSIKVCTKSVTPNTCATPYRTPPLLPLPARRYHWRTATPARYSATTSTSTICNRPRKTISKPS